MPPGGSKPPEAPGGRSPPELLGGLSPGGIIPPGGGIGLHRVGMKWSSRDKTLSYLKSKIICI